MELNQIMQFDHPIEVHRDGTITDANPNLYAPSLLDDELDDDHWEFFSGGYTGQSGYRGPIMHDSEFIGGALERDITATPGIYVAIPAMWSPDDEDDADARDGDAEGWAIARLKDDDEPRDLSR